jgi:rhodanese-related sulfurtransferase
MSMIKAHLFRQRKVGPREEVKLKLFDLNGKDLELGGVRKAEVILDHAAILAMAETPHEVIAPTESADYDYATVQPVIIRAYYSLKIGSNPYANFSPDETNALVLCYGADQSTDAAFAAKNYLVDNAYTISVFDMRLVFTEGLNRIKQGLFHTLIQSTPDYLDNGIYLALTTPITSGPLTGGNDTDQLKVTVWYDVVEVAK